MAPFDYLWLAHNGKIGPVEWITRDWRRHLYRYLWAMRYLDEDSVVLDLAAGSCYGSQMMAGLARQVYAVDRSLEAIVGYGLNVYFAPNVVYQAAPAEDFCPDCTFTHLVSFETLEHLTDPAEFLRRAAQEWIPNGTLLLSVPAYDDLSYNPYHKHYLPLPALRELIQVDFEIEKILGQADDGRITVLERAEAAYLVVAHPCPAAAP